MVKKCMYVKVYVAYFNPQHTISSMSTSTSTNDNELLLAGALSAILGKEILPESSLPPQSQHGVSKVSLFDQHLTSFVYGEVDADSSTGDGSLITLQINILAAKNTFSCIIRA